MARIKPGTKHPTKPGLVMGKNGRYVAKSTYRKQLRTSAAQNAAGKLAKRGESRPASQRIQKVKVKVESPKQLTGSKGQKQLSGSNPKQLQGTNARRLAAQQRQQTAARGTRGSGVRTGGTSNIVRSPQTQQAVNAAKRMAEKTGYAQDLKSMAKGAKNVAKAVGKGARGVGSAIRSAGPAAKAAPGVALAAAIAASAGKKGAAKMSKLGIGGDAPTYKNPLSDAGKRIAEGLQSRSIKGRGGSNRTTAETKPQRKRGMSNIPKAEQYVNNPNYGKKSTTKQPAPVKPAGTVKAATQKTTITAPGQGKPQVKKAQEKKAQEKKATQKTSAYTRVTESKATDKTVDPKVKSNPALKSQKAKLTARQQMLQRKQQRARQVLNSRTASAREKMQARIILRSA